MSLGLCRNLDNINFKIRPPHNKQHSRLATQGPFVSNCVLLIKKLITTEQLMSVVLHTACYISILSLSHIEHLQY